MSQLSPRELQMQEQSRRTQQERERQVQQQAQQNAIRQMCEQAAAEIEIRVFLKLSPILKETIMTVVGKVLQAAGAEIASLNAEIATLQGQAPPPPTGSVLDSDDETQLTDLEKTLGLDANGDPMPATT